MGPEESEGSHLPRSSHGGNGRPVSLVRELESYGVRADKRLGQHFLISDKSVSKILARAMGLRGILEIGPGPGILTTGLAEIATVLAIDLDPKMAAVAQKRAPRAQIIVADALEQDWRSALSELPEPRGIVSNMPYNITGPLLQKVFECRDLIDRAVLMMQREVGDKIVALPGDRTRGSLSVVMQAHFEIELVARVPPGAFWPPPKVDSVVLQFLPKADPEVDFVEAVRAGFRQPRKTLANNLSALFGRDEAARRIEAVGLVASIRAHELTESQWSELVRSD